MCLLAACGESSSHRARGDAGDVDMNPVGASDAGMSESDAAIEPRDDGTCDVPEHCKAPADACAVAVCVNKLCMEARIPAGSPAGQQTPGDCVQLTCDANGKIVLVADATDVPLDDGDLCTEEYCDGPRPMTRPRPEGAPIPDAAQTGGDCKSLTCNAAGEVITRIDSDDLPREAPECRVPACDGQMPSSVPAQPGLSCGAETDVCNGQGKCVACVAAKAACTADWQCCGGVCNPEGCAETVCRANDRYCKGHRVMQCSADGQSEMEIENCGLATCDEATVSCSDTICTPNAAVCDGEIATKCNADGTGFVAGGKDCLATDQICSQGKCVSLQNPEVDTVGGNTLISTEGSLLNLNGFRVTTSRTLTQIETYVKLSAALDITFVVFESLDQEVFTLIAQKLVKAPAGEGYTSSGSMSVPLVSGRDYAIGTFWTGTVESAYESSGAPFDVSFGTLLGDTFRNEPTLAESFSIAAGEGPIPGFPVPGGWAAGVCGGRIYTAD